MFYITQIPKFPDYYAIKSGLIYSYKQGYCHVMQGQPVSNLGHLHIPLWRNRRKYWKLVHRLILRTFVGPPKYKHVCRHLDGNPQNNDLGNLKWGTDSENKQDRNTIKISVTEREQAQTRLR